MEKVAESVGETEVKQTPLFYNHEYGNNLQEPRLKRLRYKNVLEQAIHFYPKEFPCNSMLFTRAIRRAQRHKTDASQMKKSDVQRHTATAKWASLPEWFQFIWF